MRCLLAADFDDDRPRREVEVDPGHVAAVAPVHALELRRRQPGRAQRAEEAPLEPALHAGVEQQLVQQLDPGDAVIAAWPGGAGEVSVDGSRSRMALSSALAVAVRPAKPARWMTVRAAFVHGNPSTVDAVGGYEAFTVSNDAGPSVRPARRSGDDELERALVEAVEAEQRRGDAAADAGHGGRDRTGRLGASASPGERRAGEAPRARGRWERADPPATCAARCVHRVTPSAATWRRLTTPCCSAARAARERSSDRMRRSSPRGAHSCPARDRKASRREKRAECRTGCREQPARLSRRAPSARSRPPPCTPPRPARARRGAAGWP